MWKKFSATSWIKEGTDSEIAETWNVTHSTSNSSSNDTTPIPDAPSPPKEDASSQSERETTSTDIINVISSTPVQTEKSSSPPPSSMTDEALDTTTESLSTTGTSTLSPPTVGTHDDQVTKNIDVSSPQQPSATVEETDNDHNHQTVNKLLPSLTDSLSTPSIDSIDNDPATSSSTSHLYTLSQNSTSKVSAISPSTSTVSDGLVSSNSTTATTEGGGNKAKRTKRKPYQTPTAEQLESLVNGHLNDKLSISAAARRAGIARSTASSLMKKHKTQGSIPERQPRGRTAPAKIQAEQAEWIDRYLLDHESATLEMIRVALLVAFPNISQISLSGLQRNITLKCTRHLKRRRQNKRAEES